MTLYESYDAKNVLIFYIKGTQPTDNTNVKEIVLNVYQVSSQHAYDYILLISEICLDKTDSFL